MSTSLGTVVENKKDPTGYVYLYKDNFLNGLVFKVSSPPLVMPLMVTFFCGICMLVTVTIHIYTDAMTVNWLNKLVDIAFSYMILSSVWITLKYKKKIIELSTTLDSWDAYIYLEKETVQIKQETKQWADRFNFLYLSAMYIGGATYCLFPLGRFLYQETTELIDLLIYPCWTPLPIDTHWGFCITYIYQSIIIFSAHVNFGRVFSYKTICFVTIGNQMRLLGIAILTIDKRVERIIRENKNVNKDNWHIIYNSTLEQEIRKSAIQFQILQRAAKETTVIFKPMTSLSYHVGMWVLCAAGVKLATDKRYLMLLQAFILSFLVMLNQYIYSIISENLMSEVERLRIATYSCAWYDMPVSCQKSILQMIVSMNTIPSFSTYIGTKTSLENFSRILNGSYYYVTLLLAMQKY